MSFDQLVEMANFNLEDNQPQPELEISLNPEEGEEQQTSDNVEQKAEETTEEKEEPVIQLEAQLSPKLELLKERLNSGDLEDVVLEIDGVEKKLSELEDVDDETYQSIIEDDRKYKQEQLKKNYVSIENLNETQKALIDIVRSGDLEKARELFENPQQLQEPFQGFDNDNDSHNEQVLRWFYQQQGNSPKEIDALIKVAKEDLSVDAKAEKIVTWQREQYKQRILDEKKAVEDAKQAEQERIKTYKKDLSKVFKEDGLEDAAVRKFTDVATRYTKDGDLEIDSVYNKLMEDPNEAKHIIHFLLDRNNYLEKVSAETKKEVHKNVLRKVNIIRDNSKTTTKKETEEDKSTNNFFDNLTFQE